MVNNIFDTHAHYTDEAFDSDRDELLSSLPQRGVCAVINCGTDLKTSRESLVLSEKYDYIYAAVGVHPEDIEGLENDYLQRLREMVRHEKCVAIGEIGLEYHYDFIPRERQLSVFEEQIILANELNLPVIIHDREAHEDTLRLIKKHSPRGVVHCFSGSAEMAKEVVKAGMYIGLGGALTFKNARKAKEVLLHLPPDRLLLETDCPYMAPVPFRGQRNDSSLIAYVAEVAAGVRGVTAGEILDKTRENACTLFNIPY